MSFNALASRTISFPERERPRRYQWHLLPPAVEVEDDGDGPGRVGSAELFVTPNDPPPGLSVAPVNESIPAPASPREARPHVYFAGEPRNG